MDTDIETDTTRKSITSNKNQMSSTPVPLMPVPPVLAVLVPLALSVLVPPALFALKPLLAPLPLSMRPFMLSPLPPLPPLLALLMIPPLSPSAAPSMPPPPPFLWLLRLLLLTRGRLGLSVSRQNLENQVTS